MCNIHRQFMALSLLTAVLMAMAVCWVAGCAKKSGPEAVPETRDMLTVISDTLSETHDTLSETPDTLLIVHEMLSETPSTITDKRDGKTYRTVTIGKQTWMAENLNYQTDSGSWCYNDSLSYCKKYGRLYDWKTAMAVVSSSSANPSGVKGVCPAGWHLPSRGEWDQLAESVGGTKVYSSESDTYHDWYDAGKYLKSTSGWNNNGNGTDEYGFSALPGGYRYYSGGSFGDAGYYGYWWTVAESLSGYVYSRDMHFINDYLYEGNNHKDLGFAVRCVRDAD